MKKHLVSECRGWLIGVSIGVGAMWWFDWPAINRGAADNSTQPSRNRVETDPVCNTLDFDKLFKQIIPETATPSGERRPTELQTPRTGVRISESRSASGRPIRWTDKALLEKVQRRLKL